MISRNYEKPQLYIEEFELEDVLAVSSVVHTTAAPTTTLPGSTSSGVQVGGSGSADIVVDLRDFSK